MEENIIVLKKMFSNIEKMGWVRSHREGYGGLGRTFENLIGKGEENFEWPDFEGIEIKTKRAMTKYDYVNLFSYRPESNYIDEISRLKDTYGYPDKILKNAKVLNISLFANKNTKLKDKFLFKLKIDRKAEKIFLCVYDVFGNIIEENSYWCFNEMEIKLYRKMSVTAIVEADTKILNNQEYFKYKSIKFYKLRNFSNLIDLFENGSAYITLKIGVNRSGNKINQIHDHGTSFSVKLNNLDQLFEEYII
jgi:hypothetical protein